MFNSIKNKLRSIFKPDDKTNLNGNKVDSIVDLPEIEKEKVLRIVKEEREKELNNHPKIAIIGKTGVGKSSTINNLFRVNLGVSHFEACTQDAEPVTITNGKGKIVIYDMPGLGEDLEKDEQHKKLYKEVLPKCDVVLWILNIADREMSSQQTHIKEISEYLENTLVICANKADILEPAEWIDSHNLPSLAQEENLKKRIKDIRKKLCKIVPDLEEDRIVYYSAKRKYKLNELFRAMMDACPVKRAWVLESRMDVAEFTELVDLEDKKNNLKMAENKDDDFIYGRLQNELKEIEEQKKRIEQRKRESESNWLADLLRQIGKALAYPFELLAKLFEKTIWLEIMKAKLLLLLLLFTFITFAQQTKPLCVSDTGQTNVKAHNTANVAPQVIYLKSESEKKDWSDIWLPIFAALLVTIGAYMGVLKQSKASSISGFRVNWIEDLRVSYSKFLIALRNVDNKIRNGTIDPNNYSKDDDEEDLQFLKTKIKLLLNHNPLRNPDHVEFYSCLLLYMEEHKDYYRGQPSDEKLQALDKRKAEMEEVLLNILKSEWEKAKKFT